MSWGEPFRLLNIYRAWKMADADGRGAKWARFHGVDLRALAAVAEKVQDLKRILRPLLPDNYQSVLLVPDVEPIVKSIIWGAWDNRAVQTSPGSPYFRTTDGNTYLVPRWEAVSLVADYSTNLMVVAVTREEKEDLTSEVHVSARSLLSSADAHTDPEARRRR